jgi:hypothetical protein
MKKVLTLALVLGFVLVGVALADKSVKECMGKLNKGPNALCPTIGKALKDAEPDWNDLSKMAKEFVEFATALTKAEPPMGDKEAFKKKATAYCDDAKALLAACEKKDQKAAAAAHGKLSAMKTCAGCHSEHRPK